MFGFFNEREKREEKNAFKHRIISAGNGKGHVYSWKRYRLFTPNGTFFTLKPYRFSRKTMCFLAFRIQNKCTLHKNHSQTTDRHHITDAHVFSAYLCLLDFNFKINESQSVNGNQTVIIYTQNDTRFRDNKSIKSS